MWYSKSFTKKTCDDGEKPSFGTIGSWRQVAAVASASMSTRKAIGKSINVGGLKFEKQWQEKILSHGSSRDKILLKFKLILSNPVANGRHLDSLVPMVTPAKKRDCSTAIDTLRKLFLQLLPKSRTLIPFDQRPFHILDVSKDKDTGSSVKQKKNKESDIASEKAAATRDQILALWLFEDNLKRRYEEFISNMEVVVLRDVLEANKKKALGTMFELLQNKPEQRERLVRILANKVGDPSGKLASHAKHKLLLAVNKKLSLVPLFVSEFEQMLYRPNIREKAQYFVICCLNSMQLKRKAGKSYDEVPITLIKIYCSFFRAALDQKKIVKRKMLGALLSGIHRAFPFMKREEVNEHLQRHINDIFRLVHTTHTFNQSVQALMVLFHFNKHHEEMRDRFYQVLYRKLGDWRLIRRSSQQQTLLLHLIFRSLSEDDDLPRLKAFTKRLLTLCLASSDTPLICGLLLVLSELQKTHSEIISTQQLSAKIGGKLNEDSEDEYFPDIDSDAEEEQPKHKPKKKPKVASVAPSVTAVRSGYDPTARNPRYCGAEKECTWELLQLKNNFYHPSVRVFATALLNGTPIDYSGDPFEDFTRIHFLDRFLQKKPKRVVDENAKGEVKARSLAVNSDEYRNLDAEDIPVDEKCFYEFAQVQGERKRGKREEEDDEVESVDDDDFDAYLDSHEEDLKDDLKDLDDINSEDEDDDDDDLKDLSDEEMEFSASDDEDDDGDDEGLGAGGYEDSDDPGSELDSDNEEDDGMMEVDEEEEDDEDDEYSGYDGMTFGGEEESASQKKQRQWEDKRQRWMEGSRRKQTDQSSFSQNRGHWRGRRERGGHRGRGRGGSSRGRSRGWDNKSGNHRGGGTTKFKRGSQKFAKRGRR